MVTFWTTSFAMEIANEYTCLDAVKSLGEEKKKKKNVMPAAFCASLFSALPWGLSALSWNAWEPGWCRYYCVRTLVNHVTPCPML
jgi:hypothetical protein